MRFSRKKLYKAFELVFFFIVIPVIIGMVRERSFMVGLLWGGAVVASLWMWLVSPAYRKEALNLRGLLAGWRDFWPLFLLVGAALCVAMYVLLPQHLFAFPLERPYTWLMVMLLYPLLSALPQEIIYRSFFFHRYADLLSHKQLMIWASAILFGGMHAMFGNWVAVVMSTIGGWLFSRSYAKYRSLPLVVMEHALYGCLIFTLGLGIYFYSGYVWN